jgi:hypothetical protein
MGQRGVPKVPWFVFQVSPEELRSSKSSSALSMAYRTLRTQNIGDKISHMNTVEAFIEKHCRNGANIYVSTICR